MRIKKIFKRREQSEYLEIEEGSINKKDEISPLYINLKNPKYFEIDEIFYSGIIIYNYNKEYEDIILKNIINSNLNINISIFCEKQDSNKAIKELTYLIGNNNVEILEKSKNSSQIDLMAFSNNDAKYIRKQIQLENEELYFLYIYITIWSED